MGSSMRSSTGTSSTKPSATASFARATLRIRAHGAPGVGGPTRSRRASSIRMGRTRTPSRICVRRYRERDPQDLQPNSLTWNTEARQWLLVGQARDGAYFSLSPDLITWTRPQRFFEAQTTWDYECGKPDPFAYPSLIDPASPSRNFDTSGKTAYLYFTQFHYMNCQMTADRDLVRVRVAVHP